MRIITMGILFCLGLFQGSFAQPKDPNIKPSIALLGMFHFGETSDLAAIKMSDLHSRKRQAEIQELLNKLKVYAPTKILVEYPFASRDTLQKRYEAYLAGNYTLGDSETYQLGFRLAEALGHSEIYAMDHKMDLPFEDLTAHLTKVNKMEKMDAMMRMVNTLMQKETEELNKLSLSQYLVRLNSESFDALANSVYLKEVLEMGSPENEVGAKVSAIWYQRNMIMLKNITSYIKSHKDRILVIVGSSHRAVLKDYIQDRTDLKYIEISEYLD